MRISIAIPHFNRWRLLQRVIDSLAAQTFTDFEVVVSDDCSTDESRVEVPPYLAASGLRYRYVWQEKNLGYDANLRASLHAASGEFLLILGNDDELADTTALQRLAELLGQHNPAVALCNLIDASSGSIVERCPVTAQREGSPELSVLTFRSFSAVAGIIFSRRAFLQHDTARFDQSIYVQVFLAARIIAAGGTLLFIADPLVRVGIDVGGTRANNFYDVLDKTQWQLRPATGGLASMTHVAGEAIGSEVSPDLRSRFLYEIAAQMIRYPYPFWLFEYRRKGYGRHAVNLALGCTPARLAPWALPLSLRLRLWGLYLVSTGGGLIAPLPLLRFLKTKLYRKVKKAQLSA